MNCEVFEMSEGDFWNNLDSFVEKQSNDKDNEKVGDWLRGVPDAPGEKDTKPQKSMLKSKSPTG